MLESLPIQKAYDIGVIQMKKGLIAIVTVVILLAILVVPVVSSYNGFVTADENVEKSYAQIENQLQRRLDLIPNLVNTVKGYATHEKEVIESVSDARAKLAGAGSPADKANADEELSNALSRLLVISENYPDLKANENFQQLMDELAGTENRIAVARQDYNDQVSSFNKKAKQFPGNITAKMFNFDQKEYFKADETAKDAPPVDFEGDGE